MAAGERYLAFCLQQLGVLVVYPETLPLPEQMRIYAEAEHLVFSEGSAIHGRQLLGRIDQHISILRRRFRSHIAQNQIQPRCTSLSYVACYQGGLFPRNAAGWKLDFVMCSTYRVEAILDHFESLGVPLRRVWSMRDYERQRDDDILAWIRAMYSPRANHWLGARNDAVDLVDQLEQAGVGHLGPEVTALLAAYIMQESR